MPALPCRQNLILTCGKDEFFLTGSDCTQASRRAHPRPDNPELFVDTIIKACLDLKQETSVGIKAKVCSQPSIT